MQHGVLLHFLDLQDGRTEEAAAFVYTSVARPTNDCHPMADWHSYTRRLQLQLDTRFPLLDGTSWTELVNSMPSIGGRAFCLFFWRLLRFSRSFLSGWQEARCPFITS